MLNNAYLKDTTLDDAINQCFFLYDTDNSGFLEESEVRDVIHDICREEQVENLSDIQIENQFLTFDDNGDGKFQKSELRPLFTFLLKEISKQKFVAEKHNSQADLVYNSIVKIFVKYDRDCSGYLDQQEITSMLGDLCFYCEYEVNDQHISKLILKLDADNNGIISLNELLSLIKSILDKIDTEVESSEFQDCGKYEAVTKDKLMLVQNEKKQGVNVEPDKGPDENTFSGMFLKKWRKAKKKKVLEIEKNTVKTAIEKVFLDISGLKLLPQAFTDRANKEKNLKNKKKNEIMVTDPEYDADLIFGKNKEHNKKNIPGYRIVNNVQVERQKLINNIHSSRVSQMVDIPENGEGNQDKFCSMCPHCMNKDYENTIKSDYDGKKGNLAILNLLKDTKNFEHMKNILSGLVPKKDRSKKNLDIALKKHKKTHSVDGPSKSMDKSDHALDIEKILEAIGLSNQGCDISADKNYLKESKHRKSPPKTTKKLKESPRKYKTKRKATGPVILSKIRALNPTLSRKLCNFRNLNGYRNVSKQILEEILTMMNKKVLDESNSKDFQSFLRYKLPYVENIKDLEEDKEISGDNIDEVDYNTSHENNSDLEKSINDIFRSAMGDNNLSSSFSNQNDMSSNDCIGNLVKDPRKVVTKDTQNFVSKKGIELNFAMVDLQENYLSDSKRFFKPFSHNNIENLVNMAKKERLNCSKLINIFDDFVASAKINARIHNDDKINRDFYKSQVKINEINLFQTINYIYSEYNKFCEKISKEKLIEKDFPEAIESPYYYWGQCNSAKYKARSFSHETSLQHMTSDVIDQDFYKMKRNNPKIMNWNVLRWSPKYQVNMRPFVKAKEIFDQKNEKKERKISPLIKITPNNKTQNHNTSKSPKFIKLEPLRKSLNSSGLNRKTSLTKRKLDLKSFSRDASVKSSFRQHSKNFDNLEGIKPPILKTVNLDSSELITTPNNFNFQSTMTQNARFAMEISKNSDSLVKPKTENSCPVGNKKFSKVVAKNLEVDKTDLKDPVKAFTKKKLMGITKNTTQIMNKSQNKYREKFSDTLELMKNPDKTN